MSSRTRSATRSSETPTESAARAADPNHAENHLKPQADEHTGETTEQPHDETRQSQAPPSDSGALTDGFQGSGRTVTFTLIGLLAVAVFYTLYFAKALFLPIVLALVLNFLLSPIVAWFQKRGVPTPVGGAVVLVVFLALLGTALYQVAEPAATWVDKAPERMEEVEAKVRELRSSLEKVEAATEQIEQITGGEEQPDAGEPQEVRVAKPSLGDAVLAQAQQLFFGGLVMIFLLYFLLASGDLFLRKLIHVLPSFGQKRGAMEIVRRVEEDLSRYFLTITLINIGLGAAVGAALALLGLPNPFLWGMVAGLANYVPYIGAVVGIGLIGLVGLVSFETVGEAMLAPLAYVVLNTIEAYLVTPAVLGRRLMLNPVAVFISIIVWGWIWGIAGAILAVPLLVSFKILCDNVHALSAIGEFLGR